MAIFNGRYSWDGKKTDNKDPISWFPGAYDLKIINLEESLKSVSFMRPYLCVFTNTGSGYSVSANPEKFAKRICEDFSLEIEKVLWVEQQEQNSEYFEIILFQKKGQVGSHVFYSIERRKPMDNELNLIRKELFQNNH